MRIGKIASRRGISNARKILVFWNWNFFNKFGNLLIETINFENSQLEKFEKLSIWKMQKNFNFESSNNF